jgi:hypothetical protein
MLCFFFFPFPFLAPMKKDGLSRPVIEPIRPTLRSAE